MRIGIMAAMPEEMDGIWQALQSHRTEIHGNRTYHIGQLHQHEVVVVFSRWGKVAAASTVTTLLHRYKATHIVFTGVAGALNRNLEQGDVVVAQRLIQYDMDARPLMPQFEIPLLNKTYFECNQHLIDLAEQAFQTIQHQLTPLHPKQRTPLLLKGDIGSADRFVGSTEAQQHILGLLPQLQCIEMEGAAVAQVCYEHQIPFVVLRTISDAANDTAAHDFPAFLQHVAGPYATHWMNAFLQHLAAAAHP